MVFPGIIQLLTQVRGYSGRFQQLGVNVAADINNRGAVIGGASFPGFLSPKRFVRCS